MRTNVKSTIVYESLGEPRVRSEIPYDLSIALRCAAADMAAKHVTENTKRELAYSRKWAGRLYRGMAAMAVDREDLRDVAWHIAASLKLHLPARLSNKVRFPPTVKNA